MTHETTFLRARQSKAHRDQLPIDDGVYQVHPWLRIEAREIAKAPYRDDVAQRVMSAVVLVLRLRAGPLAQARWRGFLLPVRFLGDMLQITKAQAETVLRYLDGRLIERVAVDEDVHGRPVIAKRQLEDGSWINKPIYWRFTQSFQSKIDRINAFFLKRKSDVGKAKDSISFLKSSIIMKAVEEQKKRIQEQLPMSELHGQPRLRPSPPSRVASASKTLTRALSSSLDRIREKLGARSSWKAEAPSSISSSVSTTDSHNAVCEAPRRSSMPCRNEESWHYGFMAIQKHGREA